MDPTSDWPVSKTSGYGHLSEFRWRFVHAAFWYPVHWQRESNLQGVKLLIPLYFFRHPWSLTHPNRLRTQQQLPPFLRQLNTKMLLQGVFVVTIHSLNLYFIPARNHIPRRFKLISPSRKANKKWFICQYINQPCTTDSNIIVEKRKLTGVLFTVRVFRVQCSFIIWKHNISNHKPSAKKLCN